MNVKWIDKEPCCLLQAKILIQKNYNNKNLTALIILYDKMKIIKRKTITHGAEKKVVNNHSCSKNVSLKVIVNFRCIYSKTRMTIINKIKIKKKISNYTL